MLGVTYSGAVSQLDRFDDMQELFGRLARQEETGACVCSVLDIPREVHGGKRGR
jgi:hypothetical protein